jgi:adenylate cyclase class IV
MQNIEIKTPLPDPAAVRARLAPLGARRTWERRQRDVFFPVPAGYLKLRQVEGQPPELIAYEREAGSGPRASDYDIAPGGDGERLERVLARALGVRGVVEKTRELWLWKQTRIHLDTVTGLGSYLELEAVVRDIPVEEARAQADHLIEALALDPAIFNDRPYLELLEAR